MQELGINVQTIVHAAAPTVEEHSKHVGHIEGGGQAKNLCLKCVSSQLQYPIFFQHGMRLVLKSGCLDL